MKLNIYMKSGNVIKLHFIQEWKATNEGNTLVGLNLKWRNWWGLNQRPIMNSLDLSQVEVITQGGWL